MKSLFFSGFMGTGKTTVGPLAAARLGVAFVDTDAEIVRAAGMTIAELWRRDGEAKFRERERAVVERYLDDTPRVVALGGGSLLSRSLRHAVLDKGIVITLTSEPSAILRRIGDVSTRPNLASTDPLARVRELLDARKEAYAECHAQLSTDELDADDVAEAACAVLKRDPLVLPLGTRSYPMDIVHDAPEALTDAIARIAPSSIVVVTDAAVRRARGAALARALSHLALPSIEVTLAAGEEQKTLDSVHAIWDRALGAGVDRDTLVVAFGGGVTSDLAGFAAATLLRGVAFMTVPTTLLAMVDASVGGKTGFDHPMGKNLLGAIHQPRAVVVDTAHLTTLPARELRAGLAEIVKVALIDSASLFERLENEGLGGNAPSPDIVREAIAIKARIVRDDERDGGRRRLLNLGHTIGHALEAHGGYRKYLHGEAVGLGVCTELAVCVKHGFTPPDVLARTRELLGALGLSTEVSRDELSAAIRFIASDKKRRQGRIALPVVTAIGCADVREILPELLYDP